MRMTLATTLLVALAWSPATLTAESADTLTARGAFEALAALEGRWTGTPEAQGAEAEAEAEGLGEAVHVFQVSAAGTVVMETMGPGTPHEMINMYHVDGDELVMTHYCAGGNQPTMQLDRAKSSAERMVFDFTGGTNFDPAVDPHIHNAEIELVDGKLESRWQSHANGKPAGGMIFHLTRAE